MARAALVRRALSSNPAIPITLTGQTNYSYSAAGEDLVARTLLMERGIDLSDIFYVDIGAAEPEIISNTVYFYRCGASGLLVEPDPLHVEKLRKQRPRDTVLPIAISADRSGEGELFRLTSGVFNSLSRDQAEFSVQQSLTWEPHLRQKIEGIAKVQVRPINDVLGEYCSNRTIHFMSIDIEGSNFEVLRAIDFLRFRPFVICVERNASLAEHEKLLNPFGYEMVYSNNDNLMFGRDIVRGP